LSVFVSRGFSALPVVDGDYRIVDMLTKVDVLNLVVENHGPTDAILQKTVEEAIRKRPAGAEKMTTCSKKASMMLAVECILHSGAHRFAIVDSDGRLEGMLSLADLMRFLTSGFSPDIL
jgi:CBS-domain-containing membrane protein